jgi:hypothetical protein
LKLKILKTFSPFVVVCRTACQKTYGPWSNFTAADVGDLVMASRNQSLINWPATGPYVAGLFVIGTILIGVPVGKD